MLKIKILSIGKTKEKWLDEAIQEYLKRLSSSIEIEFQWAKNDPQLISFIEKEKSILCLDPAGKNFSSPEFATFLYKQFETNGSRLTFVIGGADGLPQKVKECSYLISLSKLTFTHQITRLILIEQIYRAFEIEKGSNYQK